VAIAAELSLKTSGDPMAAAEIIKSQDISIILADTSTEQQYQQFETAIQETVGLFSDRINANAIHFLSSEDLEKVQYLVQSPLFGHFVIRNYGNPRDAGQHYGRIVKATLADRAFGLKGLLKQGSKIQVVKLAESSQKQEAVEAIRNYLLAAKFQTRMASVIANAVDELLMNAIYDAPVDAVGKPLYTSLSRKAALRLDGQNAVEMHVGYDGNYVAVTAVDLYGSLDKVKLLSHISKIYTEEEYKVKTTVAGAGIGLATVFRSGGSFFFVSESRSRTEVTVFFKRTDSFRDFKDQFRFISTQFYF
jgi:hypothetical protein